MSSALTGNKIKDSYQALLKMGTNGSLDPIVPISITDGLGNDTPLQVSGNRFNTQYLASNIGLDLNFSGNAYTIGDYDFTSTTTQLKVDVNGQQIITNSSGGYRGFNLDFFNDSYQFGDINGVTNANLFVIDNALSIIKTMKSGNDIGLKLDFVNNLYSFGDFNSIYGNQGYLQIAPGDKLLQLINSDNYLELDGNHNNVWLGYYPGSYNFNNSAVVGNYMFGTDWQINNSSSGDYLFQWNTILNCYNQGLDTSTKHMENNFFINISDPDFQITSNPSIDDRISNCLIFGLTDYNSNNSLNIWSAKGINTNVVILNGTGMQFVGRTDTYFSVNASEIILDPDYNSGINIIGGDFVFKDNLYTANHRFTRDESLAINVQGRKAKPINSFSYVTAEYFEPVNTSFGQVQVEEKHLYSYYGDGSVVQFLIDCIDNQDIFVQNNSTYRVTATIVSTTGSGNINHTGNATTEQTWMVCVNSSGVVDISDRCIGCAITNGGFSCELITPSSNRLSIWVRPDSVNGDACHVKGVIKLNCITTG